MSKKSKDLIDSKKRLWNIVKDTYTTDELERIKNNEEEDENRKKWAQEELDKIEKRVG